MPFGGRGSSAFEDHLVTTPSVRAAARQRTYLSRLQWDFMPGSSVRAIYRRDTQSADGDKDLFLLKALYLWDAVL